MHTEGWATAIARPSRWPWRRAPLASLKRTWTGGATLARPNTLIYVDLPSDDPAAAARFYQAVLGWEDDPRGRELFHRMIPGGFFPNKDGSDSEVGNLHVGVYKAANARPHPDPAGAPPRYLAPTGGSPGCGCWWGRAVGRRDPRQGVRHGARILWRDHYWSEFNGYNSAFRDPWAMRSSCGPAPVPIPTCRQASRGSRPEARLVPGGVAGSGR